MTEIHCGRWTLSCDAEKTRHAFASISTGGPERCGCDPCANFVAARNRVYPAEALKLFDSLGISSSRETEVYHLGRLDSGLHLYGGWFHFVGTISAGGDAAKQVGENLWKPELHSLNEHFAIGFTSKLALIEPAFTGLPLVQFEFHAKIPWIISKPEPR